jgi:hypothetical protein
MGVEPVSLSFYMGKITYKKKYMVLGVQVPGVTTVIKTSLGWGMNALIGWAVKVTKEGKNHREEMQSAADAGTLAHAMVEAYCKGITHEEQAEPIDFVSYTDEQQKSAANAYNAFLAWVKDSKLTIVSSETEVVHSSKMYGGTIDIVLQDQQGCLHVCDIKTTNYLLPDHLIQIAAYADALEQIRSEKVVAGHLLRFNKGDATAFHHSFWSADAMSYGVQAFDSLLNLYNLKKKIEGLI